MNAAHLAENPVPIPYMNLDREDVMALLDDDAPPEANEYSEEQLRSVDLVILADYMGEYFMDSWADALADGIRWTLSKTV